MIPVCLVGTINPCCHLDDCVWILLLCCFGKHLCNTGFLVLLEVEYNKKTSIFNQAFLKFPSPCSLTFSPWKFNSIIQYVLHFPPPLVHTHAHTHTVQTHMMGSQQYDLWIVIAACGEHVSTVAAALYLGLHFPFPFCLFSFRTPIFLIFFPALAPKFSHFPTAFHFREDAMFFFFSLLLAEPATPGSGSLFMLHLISSSCLISHLSVSLLLHLFISSGRWHHRGHSSKYKQRNTPLKMSGHTQK